MYQTLRGKFNKNKIQWDVNRKVIVGIVRKQISGITN